jgi:GT2 family glycosyltransferase
MSHQIAYDPYKLESNENRIQALVELKNKPAFTPLSDRDIFTENMNHGTLKPIGLSVIILNLNRPEYIIPLCKQLLAERHFFEKNSTGFEIVIGDTGSTDTDVLAFYSENHDKIRVIHGLKYHFSKNNNSIAKSAKYNSILFLNNDIILPTTKEQLNSKELSPLLLLFNRLNADPNIGVIGAYLFFQDKTLQHAGVDFLRIPELIIIFLNN